MKRFVTLYGLLIMTISVCAQDVRSEFKKINETFAAATTLAMDLKYELFLDGAAVPEEVETGRYIRNGKKYYTLQAESEVVITDDYMYIIDREQKVLGVDRKIDERQLMNPLQANLDSLYLLYAKTEEIPARRVGEKGYRFYIKEGPYSMCEVYYDTRSYFVTEIRNVFRDKVSGANDKLRSAVLRTTFFNINTQPGTLFQVFDDKRYIIKINSRYQPAKAFSRYRFINHLN